MAKKGKNKKVPESEFLLNVAGRDFPHAVSKKYVFIWIRTSYGYVRSSLLSDENLRILEPLTFFCQIFNGFTVLYVLPQYLIFFLRNCV